MLAARLSWVHGMSWMSTSTADVFRWVLVECCLTGLAAEVVVLAHVFWFEFSRFFLYVHAAYWIFSHIFSPRSSTPYFPRRGFQLTAKAPPIIPNRAPMKYPPIPKRLIMAPAPIRWCLSWTHLRNKKSSYCPQSNYLDSIIVQHRKAFNECKKFF